VLKFKHLKNLLLILWPFVRISVPDVLRSLISFPSPLEEIGILFFYVCPVIVLSIAALCCIDV